MAEEKIFYMDYWRGMAVANMPQELADRIKSARFTKDGWPDMRFQGAQKLAEDMNEAWLAWVLRRYADQDALTGG